MGDHEAVRQVALDDFAAQGAGADARGDGRLDVTAVDVHGDIANAVWVPEP